MTITFENDNDVIVYALEKIVSYAREHQYFFVANCTWGIASIYGLDDQLRRYIDSQAIRQLVIDRGVSTIPRDIARSVSIENRDQSLATTPISYVRDPLKRTRKGRVEPLPISKNQRKKAR